MWGNRSFSSKRISPKSKLNSTVPAFVISPISTRQRQPDRLNQSMQQTTVLSGAGPPLSSPFMPQIKRALGLEPDMKRSYGGVQRRHSFNTTRFQPSNGLPHVILNKSRQHPLTERNSSMLKRSSTVKIAPPTPGKVSSPSLYQMRNVSHVQEDKNTPDTQAVVTALKERRKRSITSHEETHEVPTQHAKRRRQESQQSNASTSSMPAMPDHLPDLTNTDFSIRIETPNLQRPSRPSQNEMPADWDPNSSLNSTRLETKNNSILSSLSSSRRFAMSKRRAEMIQLENQGQSVKAQKRDPPKLSHFDSPLQSTDTLKRTSTVLNGMASLPQTNGHIETPAAPEQKTDKIAQEEVPVSSKPSTLRQLPSLKKKTSLYSGLSQNSSFRKAQYANVVATLDDYDQDVVAENRRVQQMLNDVDSSFAPKESESTSLAVTTTASSLLTVQPACVVTTSMTTLSATSPTSTSGGLSSLVGSSASTSLPSLPKSPVQEVGDSKIGAAVTTISSVIGSNQTLSGLLAQPNSAPVTSSSILPALSALVSSVTSPTPSSTAPKLSNSGNFSFGTSLAATNSGKEASAQVISSAGPTNGGFNLTGTSTSSSTPASTGLNVGGNSATTTTSVGLGLSNPLTSASVKPTTGGFSFGTIASSSTNVGVGFGLASPINASNPETVPSRQTPSDGFGTLNTSSNTQSVNVSHPPGGFNFGASTTAQTALGLSSTAAPSVSKAFSFGGTSSTPAQTSTGLTFGTTTTPMSSAPGGFTFNPTSTSSGPTQPAGGFNFTPASSAAAPGGFTFNAAPSTTSVTANTGGFSFSAGTTSSTTAPVFGSVNPTAAAAPAAFGGFSQPASTQAAVGGFNFGASNTAPSKTVSFGASSSSTSLFGGTTATSASSTPFSFNTGNASTAPSASTFSFNAGVAKTTASTPFNFNAVSTTAAASASTGFTFGQTASSTGAFGGAATQGFAFGSANQAPSFGSSNPTPAFGSTNQTPAFGSSNQTPAFGSSNQTPAFGSTNQTPAFGSTNQTPAFGNASAQPSAFGAPFGGPTQNAQSSSVFGAPATTQQSNSSVFGTSANNSNTSVFGATSNTPTGFGKSHSMPSFGSNNSSTTATGTFGFEGQTAPNVNPFAQGGPTTPAKQTGSLFGAINTNSTPQNQTGAMFAFGQNNGPAKKGFDFSTSAGGGGAAPSTGGFNFASAASSTPVFNFGASASTPNANFGTPSQGTFAVGTGDGPRPPRPIAKGRRRVQRR